MADSQQTSLSLRRAWIEMRPLQRVRTPRPGRSPYGERGLKSNSLNKLLYLSYVALLTESVD